MGHTWEKFCQLKRKKQKCKIATGRKTLVVVVGGNCQCFETFRTEVDQIPEIRKVHVYLCVFERVWFSTG